MSRRNFCSVFVFQNAGKRDFSETTFLVDGMGYLITLARCDLRGHLNYGERNLIENCPISSI